MGIEATPRGRLRVRRLQPTFPNDAALDPDSAAGVEAVAEGTQQKYRELRGKEAVGPRIAGITCKLQEKAQRKTRRERADDRSCRAADDKGRDQIERELQPERPALRDDEQRNDRFGSGVEVGPEGERTRLEREIEIEILSPHQDLGADEENGTPPIERRQRMPATYEGKLRRAHGSKEQRETEHSGIGGKQPCKPIGDEQEIARRFRPIFLVENKRHVEAGNSIEALHGGVAGNEGKAEEVSGVAVGDRHCENEAQRPHQPSVTPPVRRSPAPRRAGRRRSRSGPPARAPARARQASPAWLQGRDSWALPRLSPRCRWARSAPRARTGSHAGARLAGCR